MGKAVDINKDDLSPEERKKYDEGFHANAFNEYASNMISVHRQLPDIRDPEYVCFSLPPLPSYHETSISCALITSSGVELGCRDVQI